MTLPVRAAVAAGVAALGIAGTAAAQAGKPPLAPIAKPGGMGPPLRQPSMPGPAPYARSPGFNPGVPNRPPVAPLPPRGGFFGPGFVGGPGFFSPGFGGVGFGGYPYSGFGGYPYGGSGFYLSFGRGPYYGYGSSYYAAPQVVQRPLVLQPSSGLLLTPSATPELTPDLAPSAPVAPNGPLPSPSATPSATGETGLKVTEVYAGPAADAGVQVGDVLLAANGARLRVFEDLRQRVAAGGVLDVQFFRPSTGKLESRRLTPVDNKVGLTVDEVAVQFND